MKIAIIGGGISGLTCAYVLNPHHDITVFESASKIGGHTATKRIKIEQQTYNVDTGFIVYNDWTYPNFIRLMDELGVENKTTEMSFSVSCQKTGLEYGGNNLNTLFAQRRNILNPRFLKMVLDIVRFNKEAIADLDKGVISPVSTLGEYLEKNNYSKGFIDQYLVPMGSAIWSASTKNMLDFPILFFVQFFKNHGLLSVNNRPQWRVIQGGSSSYLKPLCSSFLKNIRTHSNIATVERTPDNVLIRMMDGSLETFDQVIFACHSDQALALLKEPTGMELQLLGAIPYNNNEVVLHTDTSLLPKNKLTWSSWNYLLDGEQSRAAGLTYNMNILQGIKSKETFCVTLNATEKIAPEKILGTYQYAHPVFSLASIEASSNWHRINGVNRTWYCGAYWGNGFHEDGLNSALKVTKGLGVIW
jgi:predicted NAD/FAD-binding protein